MTNNELNTTRIIFDSRIGLKVYGGEQFSYYRSRNFIVGGGQQAILELIGSYEVMSRSTLAIVMVPSGHEGAQGCFPSECLGKWFRKGPCDPCNLSNHLGDLSTAGGNGGSITPYSKSMVRLGLDNTNGGVIFEHAVVDRPGSYYVVAEKCNNPLLVNCADPLIVQCTIAGFEYQR